MKRDISVRCCCSADGSHRGACWSVPDIGVFSRFVDHRGLRAEFPVLDRLAYLNAGTDGPLPAARRRGRGSGARARAARRTHTGSLRTPLRAQRASCAAPTPACSAAIAPTWRSPPARARGIAQTIGGLALGRGRRDPDQRRGAPGAARARWRPRASCAAWRSAKCRCPRIAEAVGAGHGPRRLLARRLGQRAARARGARGGGRAGRCSTAPRASARSRWTCTRSDATPTRGRDRSGCAARTAPACCT